MTTKLKFRKGDKVVVLAGRDKGKQGEILKMHPKEHRAIVQGVNIVVRHQKQSAKEQGGLTRKEAPIHLSNLSHVDPKDGGATKIGIKILDGGRRVRFAKKSGEVIDV